MHTAQYDLQVSSHHSGVSNPRKGRQLYEMYLLIACGENKQIVLEQVWQTKRLRVPRCSENEQQWQETEMEKGEGCENSFDKWHIPCSVWSASL